jgi:hypothetical protein
MIDLTTEAVRTGGIAAFILGAQWAKAFFSKTEKTNGSKNGENKAREIATLIEKVSNLEIQIEKLTTKTETLIDFLVRRGVSGAVNKGWAEMHSPARITIQGEQAAAAILPKIIPWYIRYAHAHPNAAEKDLFIELERNFGDLIVEAICIPNKVEYGECLSLMVMALQAKNVNEKEATSGSD